MHLPPQRDFLGSEMMHLDRLRRGWLVGTNDDPECVAGKDPPAPDLDSSHCDHLVAPRIEARGFAVDYDDLIGWSRLEQKSVSGVAERHAVKKIAQEAGHFRMPQDCNAPE